MPSILFIIFLLHISSSTTVSLNRRILHQPFSQSDSLPPCQPPTPPPSSKPKFPFSTSTSTSDNSPFFPTYHSSPPPPPPSSIAFASFPANISSLLIPTSTQHKPSSHRLIAVTIAGILSATVLITSAVFFYRRRQQSNDFSDDKTLISENSRSHFFPVNAELSTNRAHKLRTTTSTSSEFLYLGTVVDSYGVGHCADSSEDDGGCSGGGLDYTMLNSPELLPLPPLGGQSFNQDCVNKDLGSNINEDEEVFYSPKISLGGQDSSSGTGSGSHTCPSLENSEARSSSDSSSSSSHSCSPVNLKKRPVQSPRISTSLGQNVRSPSLSPATLSPERRSTKNEDGSLKLWEVSGQNGQSFARSSNVCDESGKLFSLCSSPDKDVKEFTVEWRTLSSNASTESSRLSVSSSPDREFEKTPLSLPNIACVSDQNRQCSAPFLRSSSPERDLEKKSMDVQGRQSHSSISSSPDREVEKIPLASPALNRQCSSASSLSPSSEQGLEKLVGDQSKQSSSSSVYSSPNREMEKIPFGSPRKEEFSLQSRQCSVSSLCSSPDIELKKVMDYQERQFPSVSSSADKEFERTPFASTNTRANILDQTRHCYSSSSSLSSSPERVLEKCIDVSGRIPSVSDQNLECSDALQHPLPVPPPLPPLPLPTTGRNWRAAISSSKTFVQPINKPPTLTVTSRPFLSENATTVSPIQLPPNSETIMEETPKPKLKPLHWDKVRASSDREMVWDHLRSSSFILDEEMIETLFVVNTPKPNETTPCSVVSSPHQENRVLDPKRSQNIAIALRALNVTIEEVCEALLEGNVDALGTELLESLLKMALTKEEERKLKEHKDDSPIMLGPAEKFLKALLDVPFAFKKLDAMNFMANFESEVEYLKKSFETIEAACEELRNSRVFLRLLEAVLKTGNRMNMGTNQGDAEAFKLDTLLKLVDVKGADRKTTLLHFVVQEIIRTEGARSGTNEIPHSTLSEDVKCRELGLHVVTDLSSELGDVKKAAAMDYNVLKSDVSKLYNGIGKIHEIARLNETMSMGERNQKFSDSMNRFMKMGEEVILRLQAQESVAFSVVKEITEYFHGNSTKEEAHPFRIFMVVRDFLAVLDRVCKEVGNMNNQTRISSAYKIPIPVNRMLPDPVNPMLMQLFPDDKTATG